LTHQVNSVVHAAGFGIGLAYHGFVTRGLKAQYVNTSKIQ